MKLSDRTCKAPMSNPPRGHAELMLFCGKPVVAGRSYCPTCASAFFIGFGKRTSPKELQRGLRGIA